MVVTNWLSGLSLLFKGRGTRKSRRRRATAVWTERLEDRTLLAVSASFTAGTLSVTSVGGADTITIGIDGSNHVTVDDGGGAETVDAGGGSPVFAKDVVVIDVADGTGRLPVLR